MTELEKFSRTRDERECIRNFLEWLDEQRLEIAAWHPSGTKMMPHIEDRDAMLQRYIGIDPVKLENERRALLNRAASTSAKP